MESNAEIPHVIWDPDAKCIRIVFDVSIPGKPPPTAFLVCLPTTGAKGQARKKGQAPFWQRKHRYNKDQCVRTCRNPGDCQGGKACKGSGFGWVGKKFKLIYRFCKKRRR